jgi:hypothetical protein
MLSQALSIPSSKTRLSFHEGTDMSAGAGSGGGAAGRKQGRTTKGDLEAVDAVDFFVKRASQIDQERKIFGDFVRFVAPNEAELLNLQWDERSAFRIVRYPYMIFIILNMLFLICRTGTSRRSRGPWRARCGRRRRRSRP